MVKNRVLTIPNILTSLRIFLVPFFISAMLKDDYSAALKIVIIAGFTDSIDGIVARTFGQVSKLGIFLDPFADKVFLVSIMVVFYLKGFAPKWFILLVFLRDLIVVLGWLEAYFRKNIMIKPTLIGKLSNASQVIIFAYILFSLNFKLPKPNLGWYLLVSILSLLSLIQYCFIRLKND